jgi:hypothetical protein
MKAYWPRTQDQSWRKASFCAGGECAEIAKKDDTVVLRNSTRPRRMVRYSAEEWQSLVLGIKAGEFDDLG